MNKQKYLHIILSIIGFLFIVLLLFFDIKSLPIKIQSFVIYNVRLPRVIFTILTGAILAASGLSLQRLFKNPLIDTGILGVSSGSGLFTLVLMSFSATGVNYWVTSYYLLPIGAFVGGISIFLIVLFISHKRNEGYSLSLLILAGVAMNSICAALSSLIIYNSNNQILRGYMSWLYGNLEIAGWGQIPVSSLLILSSLIVLIKFQNAIKVMTLGEEVAFYNGIDVQKVKRWTVIAVVLGTASSVSIVGVIGFVGLVVPHIINLIIGNAKNTLFTTALFGAVLLLLADFVSRHLFQDYTVPVGIVTSIIGVPIFIFVMVRLKKVG